MEILLALWSATIFVFIKLGINGTSENRYGNGITLEVNSTNLYRIELFLFNSINYSIFKNSGVQ